MTPHPKPAVIAALRRPDELAGYRYGVEMIRRPWLDGEHAAWLRAVADVGAQRVQAEWDALVAKVGAP